ncbi:MlaE family ABC transporter permease [Candidatus Endomicrobiellum devescovinae]|jgi:phospholipid/cholesterol/gamma-HCH transport system permease protein|uniref:MlaE family ABC transporter permease n=1 Tax=Candidatus Endomicrobiellum devescovinae TaxID=3242322 RepID=UPI002824834C|nr:ABC transporter permease [Endomicrobium sp.]
MKIGVRKILKFERLAEKISYTSFGVVFLSLEGLGKAFEMTKEAIGNIFKGGISAKDTVTQMVEVGWSSLPIILLTSFFMGIVLALQVGSATSNMFNEPVYVGTITGFAMAIELGPVLTAIVVTGRVGSAITAEIGTMKVTEQLDALYTLGTDPVKYLAVPRFLGCFFMLPILTIISNIVGIYGGMILSTNTWALSSNAFWAEALDFMTIRTFLHGFIKSFFFALIIVIVACHKGFNTKGGAEGVGKATTSSVMTSMVFILIADYFLTALLVTLRIK